MEFPYPSIRPAQKEMMQDILIALQERKHIIVDAPTGIGKTIGALLPSLNYALENKKTVFFLTNRLSHHKIAVETLCTMKNMAKFNAIDIVGKQHLCSFETRDMDSPSFSTFCSSMIKGRRCKYFQNFKSDIHEGDRNAMLRILENELMTSQKVKQLVGGKFCSYEMLMESAKKADVIIGDYFHIFSSLREKLFRRTGKDLENSIIIIDEAHGLPDRLRKHMSAKLSTKTLDLAAKEAKNFDEPDLSDILRDIKRILESMEKKTIRENEAFIGRSEFFARVNDLETYDNLITRLARLGETVLSERKKSFCDRVANFLLAWKGEDYGFARILSRERFQGKKNVVLYYNAMDPSLVSRNILQRAHSAILMSGTMSPLEMHADILGMEKNRTILKSYESPFSKDNRLNLIVDTVTTRYRERGAMMYAKIASTISLCAESIKGNAAVFFPSYEMQKIIHDIVKPKIRKEILLERQDMTKDEREEVMDQMKSLSEKGAVLFGVMGASFSEGIDLPGNFLNGVVIIGLPLARPNLFTQSLISYYDQRFNKGQVYAYTYPAIIKVMQAAGRCIRSENDRGVCVFCDDRFLQRQYRSLLPREFEAQVTKRPELEIKEFFS